MLAVAGVTAPESPAERARAIDHDHPIANSTSSSTANVLNTRSALPIVRRRPRTTLSGNARSHSPVVALRRGGGELARLSSILPRTRPDAVVARFLQPTFRSSKPHPMGGPFWYRRHHLLGDGA